MLLLFSGLLACQKPTDGITPPVTPPAGQGKVYEKGNPTGQAVQQTIGPEGGKLISADGALFWLELPGPHCRRA